MPLSLPSLAMPPLFNGRDDVAVPALEPRFTVAERDLLVAAAAGRRVGLQFGMGDATTTLLAAGLPRLLAVDSDSAWLGRMAAEPDCVEAIADGRLRLMPIDIGPVGAWGWPACATRLDLWPRYWREPWDAAPAPELVLVDGRFRVATALIAAVRLGPNAVVLVHDFWSRPSYRGPLLRHFELRDEADGLVRLQPRRPLDAAMLAADLAAYGFDPR